jgi:tetratricopeptide (TPR) repeat protein
MGALSPSGAATSPVAAASAALLAAASLGCTRHHELSPPGPLGSALVMVAADLGATPPEVADGWRELNAIADRIERRHAKAGGDWIDAFNAVVFGDLGYAREIESGDVRFFRLPSVIAGRRGSCVGLGALYLALGERLGVGLDGVMVPGHFFVRTRGPVPRNVELLRRGEAMPDDWYRSKYGPWPAGASAYLRPLTVSEVAAVHWFNLGNTLRSSRDLRRAALAYGRAVAEFPGFAEAEASLGAVRQLEGALDEAEAAYAGAERARTDLPGLAQNLALHRRERQQATTPATVVAPTPQRRLTP